MSISRPLHFWNVLWPVVLVWTVLIAFVVATDTDWPANWWGDFLIVALVATAQLLLATIILRRMVKMDRLSIALASFLLAKSAFWYYLMARRMWLEWLAAHEIVLDVIRGAILVTVVWVIIELVRAPDLSRVER